MWFFLIFFFIKKNRHNFSLLLCWMNLNLQKKICKYGLGIPQVPIPQRHIKCFLQRKVFCVCFYSSCFVPCWKDFHLERWDSIWGDAKAPVWWLKLFLNQGNRGSLSPFSPSKSTCLLCSSGRESNTSYNCLCDIWDEIAFTAMENASWKRNVFWYFVIIASWPFIASSCP